MNRHFPTTSYFAISLARAVERNGLAFGIAAAVSILILVVYLLGTLLIDPEAIRASNDLFALFKLEAWLFFARVVELIWLLCAVVVLSVLAALLAVDLLRRD